MAWARAMKGGIFPVTKSLKPEYGLFPKPGFDLRHLTRILL